MKLGRVSSLVLAALFSTTPLVQAWDYFGHNVIGTITWEQMDPSTRDAVTQLLLKAPPDSALPALFPAGARPLETKKRVLFVRAQGWADLVRDELWPERKAKYDHPEWHYVNRFWAEGPSGPRRLPERGTAGELVIRLDEMRRKLTEDSARHADPERAIALAWVLHLVGDVHQPLHSSARVESVDPDGDRGGNDFLLDDVEAPNLHAFWDSILDRTRRQAPGESYFAWVQRVADEIMRLYPRDGFATELRVDNIDEWSKQAAVIAMRSAYPGSLVRGAAPPRRYQDEVFEKASRQAALAGCRLARLLTEAFGR